MYKYFPQTPSDIEAMLQKIGVNSLDELFSPIKPELRKPKDFHIPSSHSEYELKQEVQKLAQKNQPMVSFLGAGSYDTFSFSAISALTSRQEFLTSYTPYQAEISQGNLQYIFEFQSMICELTGMDVSNASMYDGATATAEAMFMATSHLKRNKVLISETVNPKVTEVVKTYAKYRGLQLEVIPMDNYITSMTNLEKMISNEVGAVIVSQPNFYGVIEDLTPIVKKASDLQSLLIMNCDPSTLSVLKTPKEWGADIACGEAQSLGIPLSFGGPYLGYLACTSKLMRKIPGRICGMTKDVEGKRGYVLTLQAREQHIRREKATSNICSNQSLMALSTVIYMSLLGPKGLKDVAMRAYNNAHYLEQQLLATKAFYRVNDKPFFKEFVLEYHGDAHQLSDYMQKNNFLIGLVLDNHKIIFCASETRTKAQMDELVKLVGEAHV